VQRKRHFYTYRIVKVLLGSIVKRYMRFRYGKIEKFSSPVLILSNHNTDLDAALVGLASRTPLRFVATENVTRAGFASKALKFVFDPIIKVKGKTDTAAARAILRAFKAGESVCLFAEGNRSYNGLTGPLAPGLGKLVKLSKVRLINYRIVGGFFAQPRWGNGFRKGPIVGEVAGDYSPEYLSGLTEDEIEKLIADDIHVDDYAEQENNKYRYKGKRPAEHIQTVLYICPKCNSIGTIRSEDSRFFCDCGLEGSYDSYGMLSGNGFSFTNIRDWDAWQDAQTAKLLSTENYIPIFSDEDVTCSLVTLGVSSEVLHTGKLAMYSDRLISGPSEFPFDSMQSLEIFSTCVLTFADVEGNIYELRSKKPYSALKYRRLYKAACKNKVSAFKKRS